LSGIYDVPQGKIQIVPGANIPERLLEKFEQSFGSHFLRWHEAFGIVPYFYIDATLSRIF
jgi:hypothetical protein